MNTIFLFWNFKLGNFPNYGKRHWTRNVTTNVYIGSIYTNSRAHNSIIKQTKQVRKKNENTYKLAILKETLTHRTDKTHFYSSILFSQSAVVSVCWLSCEWVLGWHLRNGSALSDHSKVSESSHRWQYKEILEIRTRGEPYKQGHPYQHHTNMDTIGYSYLQWPFKGHKFSYPIYISEGLRRFVVR